MQDESHTHNLIWFLKMWRRLGVACVVCEHLHWRRGSPPLDHSRGTPFFCFGFIRLGANAQEHHDADAKCARYQCLLLTQNRISRKGSA